MVLTRAFACALPVVASDIPGYREVITPETAISVAPDEPAALAAAVTALLADEPRRRAMGSRRAHARRANYSWSDIARRLEGIYERAVGRAEGRRPHEPGARGSYRNPWARGLLVLLLLAVRDPRDLVARPGLGDRLRRLRVRRLALGRGRRCCSTSSRCSSRAVSWRLTIDQALPDPQPSFGQVFSAFGIGLLGNAVLPARAGELARVAVLRRHLPSTAPARRATLLGTVFAHRLFDLPAGRAARRLGAADGEDPALGGDEPDHVRPRRSRPALRRRALGAPGRRRGSRARLEGQLVGACSSMARQGLAVLRAPVPAHRSGALPAASAG